MSEARETQLAFGERRYTASVNSALFQFWARFGGTGCGKQAWA